LRLPLHHPQLNLIEINAGNCCCQEYDTPNGRHHIIDSEYSATEALLDDGRETVVHTGNNISDSYSSKDIDSGADQHGALLQSTSGVSPVNTESDEDQRSALWWSCYN
jgi:hypothetical protein